jgi:hypothetical protein
VEVGAYINHDTDKLLVEIRRIEHTIEFIVATVKESIDNCMKICVKIRHAVENIENRTRP